MESTAVHIRRATLDDAEAVLDVRDVLTSTPSVFARVYFGAHMQFQCNSTRYGDLDCLKRISI